VNVGSNITHNIVFDNEYGVYMDSSGNCSIFGNDIGWNTINGFEKDTFENGPLSWDDPATETGNWWHDHVAPEGEGINRYAITNGTDTVSFDHYPETSMNLTQADSIYYEILETGNVVEWDAYALHPTYYEIFVDGESVLVEDWDGSDIEYSVDGLAHGIHTIEVQVYHISEHYLGNVTTAEVEDLTPPELLGLNVIQITLVDNVYAQYSAEDPSGIASWAVNDTANFEISSTGLLSNLGDLSVGNYTLLITATDPYGHSSSMVVVVIVTSSGEFPTTLLLVAGASGVIAILIIGAIGYKRKQG
jgi:parallel beta-helix repeat protein